MAASSSTWASLNSCVLWLSTVQDAENLVRRAHRRAHHRTNLLPDDAFTRAVPVIRERIVRERGDAMLEHVAHHRAGQAHTFHLRAGPSARAHRDNAHRRIRAARGLAQQDGRAIAPGHVQDS